ncbi:hybrid sensor histidine kinase/response regulator [Rhodoferax aquaticus]|uniref:Hybrid sensor histidine kinase/response regulator n=1 Tax=Rhodoferax aquaticus TaxID=2527691 RepID=A0A515ENR0_9BURK|nr:response regulator [Rhodoferax aquaticus]QDL54275.1 hybrid sensor histidine kinase/response regulator [Rhodoferax aquaticus]
MNSDFELLLAELMAEFLDELPSRCNDLEQAVFALETQQAGAFDELFRQVHSLKGTGGGVGIPIITTVCHQLESFIAECKQHFDHAAASTALAFVDLLRKTHAPEGREPTAVAEIEQALDQLRVKSLRGRTSVLLVEPSQTLRNLYEKELASAATQVKVLKGGLDALQRLLQEPFDLLVISRELPDLNALAVVAALREARCRNSEIPVVLVSSNAAPVAASFGFRATLGRNVNLIPELNRHIASLEPKPAAKTHKRGSH